MPLRWVHRRLILWTAALAVMFSVIAPTVSAALAARGVPGLDQICSVDSAKSATAGDTRRDPAPNIAHVFEHCPYCSTHVAALGMPPAAWTSPTLPLSFALQRDESIEAPTLRFWPTARSRAPPLVD